MINSLPHPVVFAHRGASAHAPENTLSAFRLALDQGADAIELDVQLSADGSLIVFHDPTVNRTTGRSGKIRDLSIAQIKMLSAGYAYGEAYADENIPTLDEVFSNLPESSLINIELKNLAAPFDNLPDKTARCIQDHKKEKQVLISSFNPFALRRFRQLLPSIPLGRLLHTPYLTALHQRLPFLLNSFFSVHLSYRAVNPLRVKAFQKEGKLVFVYTLNRPEDMLRALECGVNGFFTDDPGLARRTLSRIGNASSS